ncbi:hypothetical protein BASA50_007591 [Batrachochytrium salamandrivorans]|uniref:Uncharacterized protein n=1 Tax=Batrachochytrium salamandrivorans TaxID=1357716 RepID=A0ABQ8F6L4_9FUNG|nr:hypothetical protein BASA50_007591 [Batrachochytrium salamandrivorans]
MEPYGTPGYGVISNIIIYGRDPILDHMFNGNEEHNVMLMELFDFQANFFNLEIQVEDEFAPHRTHVEPASRPTQAELEEAFNSGKTNYKKIVKLLDKMYKCLIRFERLESQYLGKYSTLPGNSVIVSSEGLYKKLESFKNDLNRSD